MFDLMNELSELIYVMDVSTYELLFINKAGREKFGVEEITGHKCYELLQNSSQPCPFCPNSHLNEETFYTWEHTNEKVGSHYLLKDKLINWQGRMAHIEIAFDITENERRKIELNNSLKAENLITECSRCLYSAQDTGAAIDQVLRMTGVFLGADKVYVFEEREDGEKVSHCWQKGTSAQEGQTMLSVLAEARGSLDIRSGKNLVIPDETAMKTEFPERYGLFAQQGVHSMIAVPVRVEEGCIGCLAADNYGSFEAPYVLSLLSSIGYFLGYVFKYQRTLRLLEQLSYYDVLTGIKNRNAFVRDTEALERGGGEENPLPLGVLCVNINGMKRINEEKGHQEGDRLLVHVADQMGSLFGIDACYRTGGDEFYVLCGGVGKKPFEDKTQALKNLFAGRKTCSLAVGAAWGGDRTEVRRISSEADMRMNVEKKQFYHGKALSSRYRHDLDDVLGMTKPGALRRMIEEKRFLIYYQPKISADDQRVIGAEALARCTNKRGEVMAPDQFIPVLEASRLINNLDFYIYTQVCEQMREWLDQGMRVMPVSVNFSRYSLSVDGFTDILQGILSHYRIPRDLIEIEVTETVEADDADQFLRVTQQINEKGYPLSIDDFGVRNANLLLFTKAHFDVLKVDKSLIDDIAVNEKSRAVIQSIADICHKIDIKYIAEGVERQDQLEVLKQLKCDGIQGFLFSKPLPREDFEREYLIPREERE